jgi:acyl-CoA thioesterase-1
MLRLASLALFVASILAVDLRGADAPAEKKPTAKQPAAKPAAAQPAAKPAARRAPSPSLQPITDDPALPRVLLIGDSISMGYTLPVRKKLEGKANVHRPNANCGPTIRGLESLTAWLGEKKWDVIHFNFGLHDVRYMDDTKQKQVSPEDYEKNLTTIVEQLKGTGAKLIWCNTTPVPEGSAARKAGDEIEYNKIAARVMEKAGIETDDLYGYALPKLKEIQLPANVHFSTSGSEVLATKVAEEIEKRLPKN